MSRPRSRSPHYPYRGSLKSHEDGSFLRKFPWEGHNFDSRRAQMDFGRKSWKDAPYHEERGFEQWPRFREGYHGEARRWTHSPDPPKPRRSPHRNLDSRRRTPPALPEPTKGFQSPDGGGGRRARNEPQYFQERPHHSPRRLSRERLPPLNQPRYDHKDRQRASSPNWTRGEHRTTPPKMHHQSLGRSPRGSRGDGFRGRSFGRAPGQKHSRTDVDHGHGDDQRNKGSFTERYTKEPEFRERRHSSERSHDPYRTEGHRGPLGRFCQSAPRGPVIVEHDHGMRSIGAACGEGVKDRHDSEHPRGSSQDRDSYRKWSGRPKACPAPEGSQSPGPDARRPREAPGQPQDFLGCRTRSSNDVDMRGEEHRRARATATPQWGADRTGEGRPGSKKEPKKLRQRDPQWSQHPVKSTAETAGAEDGDQETLTIKVDMKRSVGQNSMSCYSLDRQLSLDLVNVGRQRLDFLPMMEHSGTYRETAMHSGTFAQEIITLVHQVKENFYRGDGLTLNERFTDVQVGGRPEEEEQAVVEVEAPIINRRIHMSELDNKLLFPKMGALQKQRHHLVSDPGDLRHDLERRRQERLEGVKVTILGGSFSQHSEQNEYMSDEEDGRQEEEEGSFSGSSWRGGQAAGRGTRPTVGVGQRRPGPGRLNFSTQRKFDPLGIQLGATW